MNNLKDTNIHPGAYHYCYAMNTAEAVEEANHFINTIRPFELHYPAALDMEEQSIAELGKDAVTDIIIAFTDRLKEENYYPILYADLNWLRNYIDTDRLPNLDIWLSEWGPNMNYNKNVTMWQYSSDGSVPGINGGVDMNISFKDYPAIIGKNAPEGDGGSGTLPNDSGNMPEQRPLIYKVNRGDSLWSIAEKFLGDGNRYKEIIALNNLTSDIIKPGQILRIPQNNGSGLVLYRVRRGNTLWEIAQRFLGDGDRYKEIMEENGLTTDTIYPGQLLRIPVEPENVTVTYTVKDGDSLWSIASRFLGDGNRYKEIMRLNNLSSEVVYPGEKLRIP